MLGTNTAAEKRNSELIVNKEMETTERTNVVDEHTMDQMGHTGVYTGSVLTVDRGLLPDGHGKMDYLDNAFSIISYEGNWQEGYWQGQGQCKLQNGDAYKGEFSKSKIHGKGEYIWQKECKDNNTKQRIYQGEFQQNQRHGQGTYTWRTTNSSTGKEESRSTYTGLFDNGQRHGRGIYTSQKLQYEGDWYQGQYHGYGVLEIFHQNTIFKGPFESGKKHGQGEEMCTKTGKILHNGTFRYDQPPTLAKQEEDRVLVFSEEEDNAAEPGYLPHPSFMFKDDETNGSSSSDSFFDQVEQTQGSSPQNIDSDSKESLSTTNSSSDSHDNNDDRDDLSATSIQQESMAQETRKEQKQQKVKNKRVARNKKNSGRSKTPDSNKWKSLLLRRSCASVVPLDATPSSISPLNEPGWKYLLCRSSGTGVQNAPELQAVDKTNPDKTKLRNSIQARRQSSQHQKVSPPSVSAAVANLQVQQASHLNESPQRLHQLEQIIRNNSMVGQQLHHIEDIIRQVQDQTLGRAEEVTTVSALLEKSDDEQCLRIAKWQTEKQKALDDLQTQLIKTKKAFSRAEVSLATDPNFTAEKRQEGKQVLSYLLEEKIEGEYLKGLQAILKLQTIQKELERSQEENEIK